MHVKLEITNFTSNLASFQELRLDNEMSHEEFVALLQYYSEVFANLFTKES